MQAGLGQTIVVENKPGASGAIGVREALRAAPDGTTMLIGNTQTHATNANLLADPGYDPVADFAPVAGIGNLLYAFVVRKDLGVKTVAELVALAKSKPGQLSYGSTGVGSGSHLGMELFKLRTGTDLQHIPFKGAAQLALELAAGRLDVAMSTLSPVLGAIREGQITAIAVPSATRAPQLPALPLLAEVGVADCEADAWLALFVGAKVPAELVGRLSDAAIKALAAPALREAADAQGMALAPRAPADFRAFHAAELAKWTGLIRRLGLKPE
jgi:tripartite-type tricarboxylate transporter receptor subunit TctC